MYTTLSLVVLVLVGTACALPHNKAPLKQLHRLGSNADRSKVAIDVCPECIQEAVAIINVLLNVVLDEGIIQSCGAICEVVANKTGSGAIGEICDIACEAVGVDEFVHLLIKADLDPIYYCQLAKLCPINDNGDGKFTNFSVSPKSAPDGTTFEIDCTFSSVNGTGMGTFEILIVDPKNETIDNIYWFEARKPGTYPEKIALQTVVDFRCDPRKGVCAYPLGTYNVTGILCNGECGAKHPHTSVYDVKKSSFEVTKKKTFI